MSVTGKLAADGTVHVQCPNPACGAALKAKPTKSRGGVTCKGCGQKFVLEVPELEPGAEAVPPPAGTQNDFDFSAVDSTGPGRAKDAPSSKSYRTRESDREAPSDRRPASGRYRPPPKGTSKRVVLFSVLGGVGALLFGGVAVVAALGGFKSKEPESKPAGKEVAAVAAAIEKAKDSPAPKPKSDRAAAKPKVEPEPPKPESKAPLPESTPPEPKTVAMPKKEDSIPPIFPPDPVKPVDKRPKKEEEVGQALKDVLTKTKRATPLVEGKEGAGSGFVIRPGIMVTNAHVIEGELLDDVRIRFVSLTETDPKPIKPLLLYKDKRRDLALFRIEGSYSPLSLCGPGTELEGLPVAVVGNPTQGKGAMKIGEVTFGFLRAPARLDEGQIFYQLEAFAAPGNSGGPVINEKTGEVVGVLTAGFLGRPTTFCIPFAEVNKALNRLPATDKEAEASKLAAARHYAEYIGEKLKDIEDNASMAMRLQLLNLRGESDAMFRKGDKVYTLGEVMRALKDEHGKTFVNLSKLAAAHVANNKEFPAPLKQAVQTRIDACNGMRQVADSKPSLEVEFLKRMDQKKAASEKAVKTFADELKKYQDAVEQKYSDAGK